MNIFITGGTSGIGKELAKAYLKDGHQVGICGGTENQFKSLWADIPENLFFFDLDVSNRSKSKEVIGSFQNGSIDLLIASAGINQKGDNGPIPDFSRAEKIIDINYKGTLNSIEAILPSMLERKKGHIVAIASGSGFAGFPGAAAYSSSKAGVITFMESLTIDLKPLGISCTTICPGFVDTPLVENNGRKMPFIISPQLAASKIKKAIENKRELYTFPLIVFFIMNLIRVMPRYIFRRLQKAAKLNKDINKLNEKDKGKL